MIRILLIEDEIKTALELRHMIETIRPEAVVAAMLQSVRSGIAWLQENEAPDLIFLDIELADGLSFEIFEHVKIQSPVIFCTAFDEYAIKAFEVNGIDYLLKPVDEVKLRQSFLKYENLRQAFEKTNLQYHAQVRKMLDQLKTRFRTTLLVHAQGNIIPLEVSSISFIHHANGNTCIYTLNKRYTYNATMDELEKQLDPSLFFRANRQYLIHCKAIESAEHYFPRKLVVKLTVPVPEPVVVSKLKATAFLRWLQINK